MKTVGIPRGLLYYYYDTLWKAFFDCLQVPYIISKKSNLNLLRKGQEKAVDEACLALKLYLGHIEDIKDQCDYILIPRIFSLEKQEQVCTNFNCLYDLIHTLYPNIQILNYNIDVKRHHYEKNAFLKLCKELGFSLLESNRAYQLAKEIEQNHQKQLAKRGQEKLNSTKTKILLVGHPYNIHDALIGQRIITYLQQQNIEIIYSYEISPELVDIYIQKISPKVHWTPSKTLLAAFAYYKDKVDGTIIISSFPCGPDSLTNEMMLRKRQQAKVLLLTFEDVNSDVAIITRLESFLDMLKGGIHL